MFRVELGVGHPDGGELVKVTPLVDAVATHSVMPSSILKRLGVTPKRRLEFTSADEGNVEYGYGVARFRIEGEEWPCPVVFGPEDSYILGGSTLDIFNLEEGDERLLPLNWLSLGEAGSDSATESVRPTSVAPLKGYRIWLRYSDGVEGEIDLSDMAGSGVFSAWDDGNAFESARIESSGAVVWDDGLELCGDALYMRLTGTAVSSDSFPTTHIPARNA